MIDGLLNKRSGILVITLPSINCSSFKVNFPGEEALYTECSSWICSPTRGDFELHFPYMPKRILDNLAKPGIKVSVVPWSKIQNSPEALHFLIRETAEARHNNEYDLSEPMRMRDHNPNRQDGLFAELFAPYPL